MRRAHPLLIGGLLAGALDIAAAFAMSWPRVGPTRVLQSIASGLLGRAAYQGDRRRLRQAWRCTSPSR